MPQQKARWSREARPALRPADCRGAPGKDPEVPIDSMEALVEFFLTAGRKGLAINRYKGLGEMTPDQLWSTTMNPETRTLLQVRAEDHTEADLMFTTLMGDQVEPRQKVHRRQCPRRQESGCVGRPKGAKVQGSNGERGAIVR